MDKIIPDFNLTLTNVIIHGFQLDPNYYGCPDEVDKRPPGVRRPFWGVWFFVSGIVMLRFGTFKPYMWCDNCFFCNFDSKIFYTFFGFAGLAVVLGGTTGGIAFHVTVKALKSVKSQLSAKTRATHRNYLLSLSLAAAVHVVCIVIPLLGFLSAINVLISLSEFRFFPFFLALIIQEHGALSTIIMFLTNNLLRNSIKKMFLCTTDFVRTVENSTQVRAVNH